MSKKGEENEALPQFRREWFEKLGLEPKKVREAETPVSTGVAVVENEEVDEVRRAEELEGRRGPLHPLVNST